jgi:hypothetical protein
VSNADGAWGEKCLNLLKRTSWLCVFLRGCRSHRDNDQGVSTQVVVQFVPIDLTKNHRQKPYSVWLLRCDSSFEGTVLCYRMSNSTCLNCLH